LFLKASLTHFGILFSCGFASQKMNADNETLEAEENSESEMSDTSSDEEIAAVAREMEKIIDLEAHVPVLSKNEVISGIYTMQCAIFFYTIKTEPKEAVLANAFVEEGEDLELAGMPYD
jgi:hypothetical protein